ncbi:hypothetical protein DWW79_12415 [Alistipes sp. AF17-16]|uniref:hypothetical protein n=1 Tax=Alistipes TaxID=239759 RepID=UPI000E50CF1F|nr:MULTISPECIES: hypothetical protein [Alistipes]RHR60902.1 hypothetical protein DWW79_12415 [Alistipes sp. AF17-16]
MGINILSFGDRILTFEEPTVLTVRRVFKTLRKMHSFDRNDIPDNTNYLSRIIALAVSGSGFFSRFRRCILQRQIVRRASLSELNENVLKVIDSIPIEQYREICAVFSQLNELIGKEDEQSINIDIEGDKAQ